jgi:hypothetical protein
MPPGRETVNLADAAVKALAMLCVALALTALSADAARLELPRVPHYQNPLPSPPAAPVKPPHYTQPSDQGKTAGNTRNNQSENSRTLWERTTEDPNAFFTAVFTAVLASSTIGLWIVTWLSGNRQSRDMQASINVTEKAATAAQTSGDAAVLQAKILRATQAADVTLTPPGSAILQDLGGDPRGMRFWINLANNGQSGTRNMFGQVSGCAISDISAFSYIFADTDLIPMVIGRGGTIEAGHIEFDVSIVLRVIAKNVHLFVFGWQEYDDIFAPDTPRHCIEYCFKVTIDGELVKEHCAVRFDAYGFHNRHYDMPRQPPTAT